MSRHRSWNQVKLSGDGPSADTRAAIEQELEEELAAEIERVGADEDFIQRAKPLLERDAELLDRLAE